MIFAFAESARGSDSDEEVMQTKRKKQIASDSEMDSDMEGQKGKQPLFLSFGSKKTKSQNSSEQFAVPSSPSHPPLQ